MKANYQNVAAYDELCSAVGQSIVECRLNGAEIVNVLASEARVSLEHAACENGEVRYGGKLVVSFLYEDISGKLCRAERGAEFFHKAENPIIAPAHTASGTLTVLGVKLRREGGQLVAACIVEGKFAVLGEKRYVYVCGGENLFVKQQPMDIYSRRIASATVEDEDEFECEFAQDILLHTECACVTDTRASIGQVDVGGELGLHFCMLRADGSLCSYERVVPFKAQVLLDAAMPESPCSARVSVLSAHVSAATDEERGKTKIVLSYRLAVSVCAYEKTEAPVCVDAYSTRVETLLKKEKVAGRVAMNGKTVTEHIHGNPTFLGSIDPQKSLLAVVFPKGSVELIHGENGVEAQGVIEAKALYKGAESGVEAVDVSLPFLFPVDGVPADAEADCSVYGFGLRVRAGGEVEAEGTVKLHVTPYQEIEGEYLSEVKAGEPKQEKTCAVSVYVPSRGDDLWTTAKRLSMSPEGVREANPHLNFPLTGEERILVYRQKREKLQK